jgi:hypothetical protein
MKLSGMDSKAMHFLCPEYSIYVFENVFPKETTTLGHHELVSGMHTYNHHVCGYSIHHNLSITKVLTTPLSFRCRV